RDVEVVDSRERRLRIGAKGKALVVAVEGRCDVCFGLHVLRIECNVPREDQIFEVGRVSVARRLGSAESPGVAPLALLTDAADVGRNALLGARLRGRALGIGSAITVLRTR